MTPESPRHESPLKDVSENSGNRPASFPQITARGCTEETHLALMRVGLDYLFSPRDDEDAVEFEVSIPGLGVWETFEMVSDCKQKCFDELLKWLPHEIYYGHLFHLRMFDAVTGDHTLLLAGTGSGSKPWTEEVRIDREAIERDQERLCTLTWADLERYIEMNRAGSLLPSAGIVVHPAFFEKLKRNHIPLADLILEDLHERIKAEQEHTQD